MKKPNKKSPKKVVKKVVKKAKNKPVKKNAPKKAPKKINVSHKIDFLKKKKNINDLFFDVVKHNLKTSYDKKSDTFKTTGYKELAKKLGISYKTLTHYIRVGEINKKDLDLIETIEGLHKSTKEKKTKRQTKEFTKHNFSKPNFFEKQKNILGEKNKMFLFRAGLYMVFKKAKKVGPFTGKWNKNESEYIIQNLPVTLHAKTYAKGYDDFFGLIDEEVNAHSSLDFFRFNYFDVHIVDMLSIPPNKIIKKIQ